MPEVMSIEVDEEFDPRPPKQPFSFRDDEGNWNWPLVVGVALAIILILTLIIVVTKPFTPEKKPVVSNWTPPDPTKEAEFLETYAATSAMATSVQSALEDWAKYYTTARLADLDTSFDLAGPQYAQLVSEQPRLIAEPEPGAPSIIQVGPLGKVERKNNIYTTRAVITWTKPGSTNPRVYKWDMDLIAKETRFLLHSVRDTDPEALQPIDFCGAADLIAKGATDDELAKQTASMPPDRQFKVTLDTMAIRLKVWEYLETAVAGTDSEPDVEPIVGSYRSLVEAGRKARSLEELAASQQEVDMTDEIEAIVERADLECGVDIRNK